MTTAECQVPISENCPLDKGTEKLEKQQFKLKTQIEKYGQTQRFAEFKYWPTFLNKLHRYMEFVIELIIIFNFH